MTLRITRFVASAAFLFALAAPLVPVSAQQTTAGSQQQPGLAFRVEIDFVNVDVTVTDEQGRFVRDLKRDDFEVDEDGKRQQVAAFSLVDIPVTPRPAAAAAPAGGAAAALPPEPDVRSNEGASGRVYVIVMDDLHVHPLRAARAKEVARNFVLRHLGPNDLAAVIHTSGETEALQDFTSSTRLLVQAIDKFQGKKLRSSVLEKLDEYNRQRDAGLESRADLRLKKIIDPLDIQRADHARRMLKTMTNMSDALAFARGRRKAVVLVSEGLDYEMSMGTTQTDSGLSTFTSTYAPEIRDQMQRMVRAASTANISVYGVDPRGLAVSDELIEVSNFPENPQLGLGPTTFQDEIQNAQDTLRTMSEETGGVAAVTSNDFEPAFNRIVGDNSTYYMLGYRSSNPKRDGRYHRIEVRVKRPGVKIRSRAGYIATPTKAQGEVLTAANEPSAILREALNSPLPVPSLPLRVFAAPFRVAAKEASVSVGIELDASRFRFEDKGGIYHDKVEIAAVALDQRGEFKVGDRQAINLELKPDTYKAVQANGMRVLFRLNLLPGRYQIRVAAHESGSDATGSVSYDLEVPDFANVPLAMSGVVLTAPSAAQMPTARRDEVFDAVLPFPHTGSRVFRTDDTISLVLELYGGAKASLGAIDLTTTVRSPDGQVRYRLEQQIAETELRAGAYGYAARVPLSDLTPGPYTLRVEAKARAMPDKPVVRDVPFNVVGAK